MSKKIKPVETQPLGSSETQASAPVVTESGPPKIIRITCTHEGFRRGGRAWSTTPTEVHVDEFSEVQLWQLFAEPRLTVEVLS